MFRWCLLRRVARAAAAAAGVWMAVAGLSGCATTTDPDDASDLPWNRQQPWEGQLLMPGSMMPGQY